jgi:hypothetical protein
VALQAVRRATAGLPCIQSVASKEVAMKVLVWARHGNRKVQPVIHATPDCCTLAHSVIPATTTSYRGPGTAGWMKLRDAVRRFGIAALCERCCA